jgi:hypothetical protein
MTTITATSARAAIIVSSMVLLASLTACGKDKIHVTCDKPQAYQAIVASKPVVVPDGLEPLDKYKEMPIPNAESPPRPEGAGCIENPPTILKSGAKSE